MTKTGSSLPLASPLAAALAAPILLGACLSWIEPWSAEPPEPVVASDGDALFFAAVAAFSGDEAGYRVAEIDPDRDRFTLRRVEERGAGEEEIEVEVKVEARDESLHEVSVLATRRRLAPVEPEGLEGRASLRRHRDEDVERAVIERIRASAAMFRVEPRTAAAR